MAKKPKDALPKILFVGRRTKEKYKLTAFKILTKDAAGVPLTCRLVKDDETIDISGGEEFMTGYVPAHMLKGE